VDGDGEVEDEATTAQGYLRTLVVLFRGKP
jgi:hypothetical protein